MALYVGLDLHHRGRKSRKRAGAADQNTFALAAKIALVGIEACPLSEWLYGALVESGLHAVCIETRHAQRFLSSRPNKTDRSDARGVADMMRLGHSRAVHVKRGRPEGGAASAALLLLPQERTFTSECSTAVKCQYRTLG